MFASFLLLLSKVATFLKIKKKFLNYIYLREREHAFVCAACKWGRGRETGRKRIPNRLPAVSTKPHVVLPMNREIMT